MTRNLDPVQLERRQKTTNFKLNHDVIADFQRETKITRDWVPENPARWPFTDDHHARELRIKWRNKRHYLWRVSNLSGTSEVDVTSALLLPTLMPERLCWEQWTLPRDTTGAPRPDGDTNDWSASTNRGLKKVIMHSMTSPGSHLGSWTGYGMVWLRRAWVSIYGQCLSSPWLFLYFCNKQWKSLEQAGQHSFDTLTPPMCNACQHRISLGDGVRREKYLCSICQHPSFIIVNGIVRVEGQSYKHCLTVKCTWKIIFALRVRVRVEAFVKWHQELVIPIHPPNAIFEGLDNFVIQIIRWQRLLDYITYIEPGWKAEDRIICGNESNTDGILHSIMLSAMDFQHTFFNEMKNCCLHPVQKCFKSV